MKRFSTSLRYLLLFIAVAIGCTALAEETKAHPSAASHPIHKTMVIGDSMSGWLGERLNAYGQENNFEVGTIVWDGATIEKYANSPGLKKQIDTQNPEVVFVCLGLNELAERNPAKLKPLIDKIRHAVGDRELIWIGPPAWPGHTEWTALNNWLENEIGKDRYFNSFPLKMERQSASNPHPTKQGMMGWGDAIADWLPSTGLFSSLEHPRKTQMARGKFFLYKRMKETL